MNTSTCEVAQSTTRRAHFIVCAKLYFNRTANFKIPMRRVRLKTLTVGMESGDIEDADSRRARANVARDASPDLRLTSNAQQ